jgi:hypothetical protein
MAGFFPGEGEALKLAIVVGQTPPPDWYVGLFNAFTPPFDHSLVFASLTQPTDPDYLPVLLDPAAWAVAAGSVDPATAFPPLVRFFFDGPDTILGWLIFGDVGGGNQLLTVNYLNPPGGVVIPAGGAQLGLTITLQDYSDPPPP